MSRRDDLANAVGFEKDVEILKQMLRSGQMFISIVGESGTGKNKLLKVIINDSEIAASVDVLICYFMEPGKSTEDLLREVYLRAVCWIPYHREESVDIGDKLCSILDGKRYLLVIHESHPELLEGEPACRRQA